MTRAAASLRIEGRVQGVGFRWWTVGEARRLGLRGWARNRADGSVEVLAIGESAAIDALEAACRAGPPAAPSSSAGDRSTAVTCAAGFRQRETL